MAHQRDIPREPFPQETLASRGYVLGRLLSQIFHPILLNMASFLIVGSFALPDFSAGLMWAAVCIAAQILPPTIFFVLRLRQGAFSDEDVSVRQQRNELYMFGICWVVIVTVGLSLLGVPRPLLAIMLTTILLGLIGGLTNLFWKISVHAAAIGSTATIALLYSRALGVTLWIFALAVGWARVRTGNHTPLQVLAGFGSAVAVVLLVFRVMI